MSDIKAINIPVMKCDPEFSVARIPVYLPTRLDTTELANTYEFTTADITATWPADIVTVSSDGNYSVTTDVEILTDGECVVGSDLVIDTPEQLTYVSYLATTQTRQAGRKWLKQLECSDGDAPVDNGTALGGVVNFANPKTRNISLPTFIPRSGGSGGTTPAVVTPCDITSVNLPVYTDAELESGTVVYLDRDLASVDGHIHAVTEPPTTVGALPLAWGILLESGNEDNGFKGCCLLYGTFTLPKDRVTGTPEELINAGYRLALRASVWFDPNVAGTVTVLGSTETEYICLLDNQQRVRRSQFTIIGSADGITIVNGAEPDSQYCGKLPSGCDVPVTTIPVSILRQRGTAYIYAVSNVSVDRYGVYSYTDGRVVLTTNKLYTNAIESTLIARYTSDSGIIYELEEDNHTQSQLAVVVPYTSGEHTESGPLAWTAAVGADGAGWCTGITVSGPTWVLTPAGYLSYDFTYTSGSSSHYRVVVSAAGPVVAFGESPGYEIRAGDYSNVGSRHECVLLSMTSNNESSLTIAPYSAPNMFCSFVTVPLNASDSTE